MANMSNKTSTSQKMPKVSVVSISYNQENFIAQTLESFLMQKTNFNFEIIIADDCSTDNTAKIISGYATRFPDLIKPILRKKNVGIQENLVDALSQATGDYIALCEGDDFWTDEEKLQLQVNFLNTHRDYALVFHPVRVFFEKGEEEDSIFPDSTDPSNFTVKELLAHNFIQTNSVMYRRKTYKAIPKNILPMDWYLHLYHAQDGKIGFINRVMSVYRRQSGGVWWNAFKDVDLIWKKYGILHLRLYVEIMKLYATSLESLRILDRNIDTIVIALKNTDDQYKTHLLEEATEIFPITIAAAFARSIGTNKDLNDKLGQALEELESTKILVEREKATVSERDAELKLIKGSKLWKVRGAIKKPAKLIRRK
jgi:glycosyltransferase involved in cell wall biosynthesis